MKDDLIFYGVVTGFALIAVLGVLTLLALIYEAVSGRRKKREPKGTQIGRIVVLDDSADVRLILNDLGDEVEAVLFPSRGNPKMN